ncbi:hydantoinase/oxoprolinase family protein [Burkholderiaceae bacterium FT117]|uniref:hydantoinase/oxoprolinase family protein n=1 Tax=Zeimonas sediminis TaxID=2944268 RepID=UPI002342DFA0|nr:hydantoinase/oxoprolinase family protein [Zeimonas sediminis]MCM5570448.1 hydantoinase/oxoprolinase family protein [Zeimonas sediminis]
MYFVGTDIGGTFTDLFAVEVETGRSLTAKVLTNHDDPTSSVSRGIEQLIATGEVRAEQIARVLHGTTLVTNALIQRRGARAALLVTEGFRDAIEIGTEHRFDLYDLDIDKPQPVIPRHLRRPVRERVLADGTVETPIDLAQARAEIAALLADGVDAIAICLLHAFRNPVHERALRDLILEMAPGMHVSLSSEVAPEIREYERASTTAINAYVAPIVEPYLRALREKLERMEVRGALLVMQSNGGTAVPETASQFPVRLLESGPAAGAIGAAYIARAIERQKVLFFDMGGTTAKAFIVDDGAPIVARKLEVAHVYRFKHGSGLPVQIPAVDMIEIGAGGGSIARIDRLGLLKVGPDSAESEPGPACYGLGGSLPTVTDADVVLGYIGTESFLGGKMRLDREAARRAIAQHLAEPLGLSVEEAAWGMHQVVNENMASAARVHLLEHGRTPADYAMVAFGGAGPTHAYGVAKALRLRELVVPWQAGVGSAFGMLCAPVSFDLARSLSVPVSEARWDEIAAFLDEMIEDCRRKVRDAGVPPEAIVAVRSVDMRYRGQGHEVQVDLEGLDWPDVSAEEVLDRFRAEYERLNAVKGPDAPIDFVTWRASARGPVPDLPLRAGAAAGKAASRSRRLVYFGADRGFMDTLVVPRPSMEPGESIHGPALIELGDATVTVGPDATALMREDGLIQVTLVH